MSEPTTASEIFGAMAGVYARCRSYRDAGMQMQQVVRSQGQGGRTTEVRFLTAFARPDRFRFEYRSTHSTGLADDRRVVWTAGGEVRSCWFSSGERQPMPPAGSLRDELEALNGVSHLLSCIVPALFLPDWGKGKPWRLLELTRLDDGRLGETECFRVRGSFPVSPGHDEACDEAVREAWGGTWQCERSPLTFWIEKDRLLLRRWEDSLQFSGFRADSVTTYEPEIGVAIPDAQLEYGVEDVP